MSEQRPGNRILLTGSSGLVGRTAVVALEAAGFEVRCFDLANGDDLRDESAVLEATRGCSAVVHAGAIAHDGGGTPAEILATNVLGTWHVLLGAQSAGVTRVVYFSSAQVFGCAEGEGVPVYVPIDDAHPLRAARPYGMSKRLAEEMCAAWTTRTGIATVVLRPVMVLSEERLVQVREENADMGAFVHVDDVAHAVVRSVTAKVEGHVRLTLCGAGPFDVSLAERVLDWSPVHHSWPGHTSAQPHTLARAVVYGWRSRRRN